MYEIINISVITDYSGETPIVTYSNPVTTVIRQNPPPHIISRTIVCLSCSCCNCCNCNCDCD
ncbi:MAG: hypothetical protein K2K04_04795 [Clostridia bacterium]|nr:hypothetical protein [Clostridia bacterium]